MMRQGVRNGLNESQEEALPRIFASVYMKRYSRNKPGLLRDVFPREEGSSTYRSIRYSPVQAKELHFRCSLACLSSVVFDH